MTRVINTVHLSDLVSVVEKREGEAVKSCQIVIECDDRTGAGFVLAYLKERDQIVGIPNDWVQQLERSMP